MREVRHRYVDPLDAIWLAMARGFGLRVERSGEVYASTDGAGTLVLGSASTLDADDCLAQMIFHELCHACVEAPEGLSEADWGLDNVSDEDVVREHACLRLQAAVADRFGLRFVLAPTTDFRSFYDGLSSEPLAGDSEDARLARQAVVRIDAPPFAPWVERGLRLTRDVLERVRVAEAGVPVDDALADALHRRIDEPIAGD